MGGAAATGRPGDSGATRLPWFSYGQEELERALETLRELKGDEGNIP
jgi:hypothetical protein